MKKIRIVHVMYSFGLGGLEVMLAGLINRLDTDRFSHSICVFHNDLEALKKVNVQGVDVHVIKRYFSNDPSTVIRLAKILKKLNPDIVRTYNWTGVEGIIAARLSGCRCIIHSEHGFDSTEISARKPRRVIARRLLLSGVSRVIAVSCNLRKWLIEDVKVPSDKVVYIPNGCDMKDFRPGREPEIRRNIGIADADVVIGAVGSLTEIKGHRYLIEAFARLVPSYAGIKLMFVGDGPLRRELEQLAQKLAIATKTIFVGNTTDPAPYFRVMDIFALPSLSENMPNSILQAMATGVPIVASDVGDVRYMLDGEKGGVIVPPKDIDGIETGLRHLLSCTIDAKQRSIIMMARARELYSIEKIAETYGSLYETCIK